MAKLTTPKKKETLSPKNKHFWSLQKRDQRTAIAADVIKQIKDKKFIAKTGVYLSIGLKEYNNTFKPDTTGKLDEVIKREGCKVCALGACFAGMVNLGDKIKVGEMFHRYVYDQSFNDDIEEDSMKEKIRELFTPEQLTLIESAFEKMHINDDSVIITPELKAEIKLAISFGRKFKTDEDRMLAIMGNIRKNRGSFKP